MITVSKMAKELNVSRQTVLAWIHKGLVRAAQPDRKFLIPEEELHRLKEARPDASKR